MNLNEFTKEVHENAVEHGWWDEERSFGELVVLMHSELSEAVEAYRDKEPNVRIVCFGAGGLQGRRPEGIAVELADCIIRILDWCGKEGVDMEAILRMKHEYNKTRPYKHGGKRI